MARRTARRSRARYLAPVRSTWPRSGPLGAGAPACPEALEEQVEAIWAQKHDPRGHRAPGQAPIDASIDAERGRAFVASQRGGTDEKNEPGQHSEAGYECNAGNP